jgi:ATP-dependent helicase Lhr and Lhr-like helicase
VLDPGRDQHAFQGLRRRQITAPSSADRRAVDVGIDFVGSLSNAAHVIASLH